MPQRSASTRHKSRRPITADKPAADRNTQVKSARGKSAQVKSAQVKSAQGELRIIGGKWRSRKLTFPDSGGVRPTPARSRETLFNWLNFHLAGARCLDLFAGSGALGLEALSRGADECVFVDHTPTLVQALNKNLTLLQADRARVVARDIRVFLAGPGERFDIVFIDPPFRQGWLAQLLPALAQGNWVQPGSWIYLEHESELPTPPVPAGWNLHRQKSAGQVCSCLFRVAGSAI